MKQAFDTLCRELTGYGINDLRVRTRKSDIVKARKVMCVYLHYGTPYTNRKIAELIGWNGDHTMVTYTMKAYKNGTLQIS